MKNEDPLAPYLVESKQPPEEIKIVNEEVKEQKEIKNTEQSDNNAQQN